MDKNNQIQSLHSANRGYRFSYFFPHPFTLHSNREGGDCYHRGFGSSDDRGDYNSLCIPFNACETLRIGISDLDEKMKKKTIVKAEYTDKKPRFIGRCGFGYACEEYLLHSIDVCLMCNYEGVGLYKSDKVKWG